MKTIRRKINIQEASDHLKLKFSDLTRSNFVLINLFTNKKLSSKNIPKDAILYPLVIYNKTIYNGIGFEGYNKRDGSFGNTDDGGGDIYDINDLTPDSIDDKNDIGMNDLLGFFFNYSETDVFIKSLLTKKPFQNIRVAYNLAGADLTGYITSFAQFQIANIKFKDRVGIEAVSVKRHYYKPIVNFEKMHQDPINNTDKSILRFK